MQTNDLDFTNTLLEETSDFGGRNKARRLAKMLAKGKTEKAAKLAAKVQAKIDKLAAKGKVDKKRYLFLVEKLKAAGEAGLTDAEAEELGNIQDEVEKDDPELEKEISTEAGMPAKGGFPKWGWFAIGGGVLLIGTIITVVIIKSRKKA